MTRDALRVGVLTSPPWVTDESSGEPGGVEAALITAFADELSLAVEWHWGSADSLFMALANYQLDIVVGGITDINPWQAEVAFTVPYYTSRALVGVPPSDPLISDLDGMKVMVRQGSALVALVEDQGGIVVSMKTLAGADGPLAAEEWEIRGLGFQPTSIQLTNYNHVMAVPRGENALIMRLEKFLLQQVADATVMQHLWEVAVQ